MQKSLAALLACVALVACAPVEDDATDAASSADELTGDTGFAKARGKRDEIRGDLASNQAHLRGVLTPAQTSAYSASFFTLDRVVAAANDYTKKANTLAANLASETAKLGTQTGTVANCGGPHVGAVDARITKARDLYNSAKLLATSNVVGSGPASPAYAVRGFYTYLLSHPDVRTCIKSVDDVEKDLGANHAQVMIQVKLEDPTADALAVVKQTFQPFNKLSTAVTTLSSELEQFARTQDGAAFAKAAATPPAKLAGGVLAILSLGELTNDLAHGRYRDFVIAALKGGTSDIASISGAVALLEGVVDSGRAGGLVAKAAGFSKLTGRVAAGVGVVTSAIQLFSDLDRYEGDRLLHLARIAADAAALQASIVAVAGLSSLIPVAGTIVLLTQTVLVIAEYWHNHEVAGRRNADTKAVLRKIGLAGDVSDTLADADNTTLRALTQRRDYALALAPTEVQRLATLAQQVSKGREAFFLLADNPGWIASAAEVTRIWNLSSDSSFAMIKELSGNDGTLVRVVFDGCVPVQSGVFANRQGFYDAVTKCRKGAAADEGAALDRLTAFLHAH